MTQAAFYGVENYKKVAKQYPFTADADNRDEISVSQITNCMLGGKHHWVTCKGAQHNRNFINS